MHRIYSVAIRQSGTLSQRWRTWPSYDLDNYLSFYRREGEFFPFSLRSQTMFCFIIMGWRGWLVTFDRRGYIWTLTRAGESFCRWTANRIFRIVFEIEAVSFAVTQIFEISIIVNIELDIDGNISVFLVARRNESYIVLKRYYKYSIRNIAMTRVNHTYQAKLYEIAISLSENCYETY